MALDIDIAPEDNCVQSLTDERILPAVGQAIRIKDMKARISKAKTTLKSMMSMAPTRNGVSRSKRADSVSKPIGIADSARGTADSLREIDVFKETGSMMTSCTQSSEFAATDEAMDDFRRGHELIMVVPWMLKTRAMYGPAHHRSKAPFAH